MTETTPRVGGLPAADIHTVKFRAGSGTAGEDLPFPVPGMSDVMPYPSSVWSRLTPEDLAFYRSAWRHRIGKVVRGFEPDIIQTNHIWLMSSMIPEAAPGVPIVAACHATGLRQMELTPHLRDEVVAGVGAGPEAEAQRARMEDLVPLVTMHGQLDPNFAQARAGLAHASALQGYLYGGEASWLDAAINEAETALAIESSPNSDRGAV